MVKWRPFVPTDRIEEDGLGNRDLSYRLMFSQPRMIQELLREFVAERWVETLDFTTLERVNADFVRAATPRKS